MKTYLIFLIAYAITGSLTTVTGQLPVGPILTAHPFVCPSDTVVSATQFPLEVFHGEASRPQGRAFNKQQDDPHRILYTPSADRIMVRYLSRCMGDELDLPDVAVVGCLERTFYVGSTSCVQKVWFRHPSPFNHTNITWPQDMTISSEMKMQLTDTVDNGYVFVNASPENMRAVGLDKVFWEPTIKETQYDLIGVTYDDVVVGPDDNPLKIARKWTVIDWCQYTPGGKGLWFTTQIINFKK